MGSTGDAKKFLHFVSASFYITILQQLDTLGGHRFIMACVMACIMACIMACCITHDVVDIPQNHAEIRCRREKIRLARFGIAW